MKCKKCKKTRLRRNRLPGFSFDIRYCPKCGYWFTEHKESCANGRQAVLKTVQAEKL